MEDEERLENIAIKAFKQHWTKILKTLEKGKKTYAKKLYGCFEADTTARQKQLADKFYGIDHARKMAGLSEKAIRKQLSCYLPKVIEYALTSLFYEDDRKEQESLMRKLVSCEYVIFQSHQCGPFESYDEDSDDLWVSEYPARVLYDDWFERSIGGLYTCNTFALMKSTGEPFSKEEVSWLRKAIQHNIDSNDIETLWWFECEPLSKNKTWIKIYECDKWLYREDIYSQLWKLSRRQLNDFVNKTIDYLSKDKELKGKKLKSLINVFDNFKSMRKKDLTYKVEDLFLKEELRDYDIRILENIVNDMLGSEDRDYHSGMNF